jgi:hypothetical protein
VPSAADQKKMLQDCSRAEWMPSQPLLPGKYQSNFSCIDPSARFGSSSLPSQWTWRLAASIPSIPVGKGRLSSSMTV